jgi:threonine dehydrogenase-like Zn-dependent dehydrogenase
MTATPFDAARAVVLEASRTVGERTIELLSPSQSGGWLTVDACGMCGSDWSWYAHRPVDAPMILGHEIVGTVRALWGELASRGDLEVGDRIVIEEAIPCLACRLCRSGRHRLCPTSGRYGATPLDCPPSLWGGFAEAVFLDRSATVHHVPKGLDAVTAALFVPVSNGLSWIGDAARLGAGETTVVLGPGQHGLACVAAARRLGAGIVVAAGRSGDGARLRAARELGADLVLDVEVDDLKAAVLDLTSGVGADVVVDTTPQDTSSLQAAIDIAAIGGRVIVAGGKAGRRSPVDTDAVFRRELTVRGVAARESSAIDAALAWLAAEPETFAPFGGLTIGLDQVEHALLALGGESGAERPLHAVVVPDGEVQGGEPTS